MKLYNSKKDKDLYYYFNSQKEKLWCYRHRYYDALGKRKEKYKQGFKSENAAYRALLEVKTAIVNGDVKKVEESNLTVSEWLDIWYETKKSGWKNSTSIERKRMLDDVIKPMIGKYNLSKLDSMTYERVFINELLKRFSPSTVKLYHRVFKVAVNAAVSNKTIKENNINSIRITDDRKNKNNFLTRTELITLLNVAKNTADITNYSLLLTLAYTGMRKGEANGLKWCDINFNEQTIKIERTRDEYGVRSPKTKNSYRTIPINDELIDQLKTYRTWCKKAKLSVGDHLSDDDFIFISKSGIPRNDHMAFNGALNAMIKRAKVKRITPHGLRHTHATILLDQKTSVITVAKRLGNTPEEIYKTYGHSDDQADKKAASVFSSMISM
ncbi:tyrosine-type recombinase/integrase [Virgibacillus salexigens]|uniref:Site-specific integrase n=1 Tax=Virgibacillus kapii TaxID=1638645 RepID=A0ABQ2DE73_9BACI|nr:tyrosine-type recombinase/integrase [Virgibacillus kapii]GGJ51383.1 site-specific integrase [Virgibacillus kapii]